MLSHDRVKLFELKTLLGVHLVFLRVVDVVALGAFYLHHEPVSLFSHVSALPRVRRQREYNNSPRGFQENFSYAICVMNIRVLALFFLCFLPVAWSSAGETEQFKKYWYAGKAEITSYELNQARYGNNNPGYAVLVFVTEDFSRSKHVKLDDPARAGKDAVKVLKMNFIKKFNTGVYRYSTMSSVFTPVSRDDLRSLKVTLSSQEWCGHVFTQLNLSGKKYEGKSLSYFQSEGDRNFRTDGSILEDEIWTRARIDPSSLPTGRIKIVPGLLISRLHHTGFGAEIADAKISNPREGVIRYSLVFPSTQRVFETDFESEFPHKIISWREVYKSGRGDGEKTLETTAQRKKTIFSDYWAKNTPPDVKIRKELGIEP